MRKKIKSRNYERESKIRRVRKKIKAGDTQENKIKAKEMFI